MKKLVLPIILSAFSLTIAKSTLKTTSDSVSYAIGINMGKSLEEIKDEINLDMLIKGLYNRFENKDLLIDEEKVGDLLRTFGSAQAEKKAEKSKIQGEKNLEEGKKFLEENKSKEGVKVTESGLQYIPITEGEGSKPSSSDKVKVHYKGYTLDEEEFDSSYKRGKPAEFALDRVIKGWTEGIQLMPVGSTYKFFIPSELAYGERGAGHSIAPNAVLVFEVELLDIVKEEE